VKRDSAGRVTKLVTTREPEWDEEQRALMLALAAWRASRCPHCGGPLGETTDPANEGRYRVESTRCHRCTALDIAARKFHEAKGVTAPHALLHRARLRTPLGPPGG